MRLDGLLKERGYRHMSDLADHYDNNMQCKRYIEILYTRMIAHLEADILLDSFA